MLKRVFLALGLLLAFVGAAEACNSYDRVYFATTTAGTGTVDVGTAEAGYGTPADVSVPSGSCVFYVIEDGSDYEIGEGTYTDAAPDTISRTVVQSSIAGVVGTTTLTLTGSAKMFISATPAYALGFLSRAQTWSAAQTFSATVTGLTFVPTGSAPPTNGMFLPAANTLSFAADSDEELRLTVTALSPGADGGNSLGTTALGWNNLFGDTGFVFNIENGDWVATHTVGILTV